MLRRILASSRYMVVIAIIGAFLASLTVLIYGGVTVITIIFDVFSHGTFNIEGAKHLAVESIEISSCSAQFSTLSPSASTNSLSTKAYPHHHGCILETSTISKRY